MERVPVATLPETSGRLKTDEEMPADGFYMTTSCILKAVHPAPEMLITRIYDLLGLRWGVASGRFESQCTCCLGVGARGDAMAFESTLLVVAKLWSVAVELGFENIATACATCLGINSECLAMYREEPGLKKMVDRWLYEACGRRLRIPKHVVNASDIVYLYRDTLAESFLRYRLEDHRTGRPLRVVGHMDRECDKVSCRQAVGVADCCEVLTGLIRSWGGQAVDYPNRRQRSGTGIQECMVRSNRGFTAVRLFKRVDSREPGKPDLILTNCPGCNAPLDEQWAIRELTGREYGIPTLSYVELAGLLLGWDPYDVVGIQGHTTPVEPLLDKIGIQY